MAWRSSGIGAGILRSRVGRHQRQAVRSAYQICRQFQEGWNLIALQVSGRRTIDHQPRAPVRRDRTYPLSSVWILFVVGTRLAPQARRGGDGDRTGGAACGATSRSFGSWCRNALSCIRSTSTLGK